jgi:uncharacterized sulfatase
MRRPLALLTPLLAAFSTAPAPGAEATRPNILWITCEDMSPDLGCFGQGYAVTPNLDRLASQGVRYTRAFAPIGVCAPSRSSLILGMFAPSVGTHHMRCQGTLPAGIAPFPGLLRAAGYYTSNNVKTDYNFTHPPGTWDESSNAAHWRDRRPDQPFFSVFNLVTTHESQIRQPEASYRERIAGFPPGAVHDPAKAPLPPYHPDTPEVRRDWARYHDMITAMDAQAGDLLRQLDADGLAESTIVFFFSDHGAGMPRSKRWLYDSSTRVPLIVRVPPRWREHAKPPGDPGAATDRLVSFVDFGPTVLSLANVAVPAHMQGRPFLGPAAAEPRQYVHGFRDRMDERIDMLRSVRDSRFKYIRNYRPDLPWAGPSQFVSYMYDMPTMRAWQRLADEGTLAGPAALFMAPRKPAEELYDTEADPFELANLAADPAHRETLDRLRAELARWQESILDLGFLPEPDLRTRFGDEAPYAAVRRDATRYPFAAIRAVAERAANDDAAAVPGLVEDLAHPDPAARSWAAIGLGGRGGPAGNAAPALTRASETDPAAWVRVAAAEALTRIDPRDDRAVGLLMSALDDPNPWVRHAAANALDRIDPPAAATALRRHLEDENEYVVRVARKALSDLGEAVPSPTDRTDAPKKKARAKAKAARPAPRP